MNSVGSEEAYRRIAEALRSAQKVAIEVENAPDKRKRLRHFSLREAAAIIGLTQKEVTARTAEKKPLKALLRRRLTFDELLDLRKYYFDLTGDLNFFPRRRFEKGEKLATVVFSNFKGGSAKTTSSVHFAQFMARKGYRVLLIDLDSQGSATAQFGLDPSTEVGSGNSFNAWTKANETGIEIEAKSLCQKTYWPNIDLLPAGAVLADSEASLAKRSEAGIIDGSLYFDELSIFLDVIGDDYDVAVVDTRPDVNMLMTVALHAATELIVPTRATMTDLSSTGAFFEHLANYVGEFRASFGSPIKTRFTKIMITAYDPTDRSQEALLDLIRERFGESVLPGEFLHSKIVGTAGFGKETLYEYEPTTDKAAYNRVISSANLIYQAIENDIFVWWGREPISGLIDREN